MKTKEEILESKPHTKDGMCWHGEALDAMQEYAKQEMAKDRQMIRENILKHWGEHIDIEDIDTIYLINPIGSQ